MAGSSSNFTLQTFSEKEYTFWSKKMEKQLMLEGLWHLIERGYKKPQAAERLNDREMHGLQQDMLNDATALSLIRQSLSPAIFVEIIDAKTAKEAWDNLHMMFQANNKTNESSHEADDKLSTKSVKISDKSNIEEDDGVMPLSGDKPFFDICLTKSAVKSPFVLNFPAQTDPILPSTNVVANVRFFGKNYDINFYGKKKRKSFGSRMEAVVVEHNLLEGDFLVFEIIKNNDYKLEINLQVLRNVIPPELEEEIRRREAEHNSKAININYDDDDNDDDDEVEEEKDEEDNARGNDDKK
ncbi:hypothetical protein DH2020_002669 [Rehmannia glutinosa]|uniref:DUF4219 domain-containing protein n=1 Tax=Rehmannia glutinosa TaxID=99300 RepID=A0ABR0XUD5_REHGL